MLVSSRLMVLRLDTGQPGCCQESHVQFGFCGDSTLKAGISEDSLALHSPPQGRPHRTSSDEPFVLFFAFDSCICSFGSSVWYFFCTCKDTTDTRLPRIPRSSRSFCNRYFRFVTASIVIITCNFAPSHRHPFVYNCSDRGHEDASSDRSSNRECVNISRNNAKSVLHHNSCGIALKPWGQRWRPQPKHRWRTSQSWC